MKSAHADVLFEIAWEVCNKVGGIYTVIMSKAALMLENYNEYVCIGPYFKDRAAYDLVEEKPPAHYQQVFDVLAKKGVACHYGTWQIKGEPKAILIDYRSLISQKNDYKRWLWDHFKIDSLHAAWDFDEPVIWSWACGMLLEEFSRGVYKDKKIVSHHHEWMAGISLLYCKGNNVPVKTTFTTHATMLGRAIAGAGDDLYGMLETINPDDEAYRRGVQDKFTTERACANESTVFTTVSEITGFEAEKILGRKPDVLVLNGLDIERFPTIEETSIKHVTSRDRLREFQSYFFFPYYTNFKLEHNIMFCFLGRYEYGNKGMDVLIDALAKLNEKMKEQASERTVTVFFWVPNATRGVKSTLIENKNYYRQIRQYVEWHSKEILDTIVSDFITAKDPLQKSIYTKEFLQEMKRDVLHFKREGNPPVVTHNLVDEDHDALASNLKARGLDNHEDDRVKVIVYPCYLDGNDTLTNLPYYDAIAGSHFAIFPSAYEPWGYTPLEAAAMGVPSLTTDLAGFGRFIEPKLLSENPGIYVLKRYKKSYDEVVQSLFEMLHRFAMLDHAERVQNKINAKEISLLADWKHLVKNYVEAHNLALER